MNIQQSWNSSDTPSVELGWYDPRASLAAVADIGRSWARYEEAHGYFGDLGSLAWRQMDALGRSMTDRASATASAAQNLAPRFLEGAVGSQWSDYLTEYAHRWVIFADTLRRRGNQFIRHEQDGCPPVLAYDYDVVVDGRSLPQPVNYSLVRVKPPTGLTIDEANRPYVIIDPRAGHGSGIGGFKSESEVGVALAAGHPTYFCVFSKHPTPTQTIADVCRAEAHFVREVQRRHPQSPKPVIIGNCQGGWAAMLLTATNPDLTGPVVVNGAPLSYWSGMRGKNPMRYLGGLVGGVVPALLLADLGGGQFDGAHLVQNFENLNPANTFWKKYYTLFAKAEDETEHYLEFERWWSGFYFMNEGEIRWITENLFIGNKPAYGTANLDSRLHVDFRNIRAPIVVFASHGDNITPPAQALNWIRDLYTSVSEIKARGQRIIYTVHESVGHLGIFVSSSVANKQHKEISSTLGTIEALAPGLYEMEIVDVSGEGLARTYQVEFHERTIADLDHFGDSRNEERPFAAAARVSEIAGEVYRTAVRPLIRPLVSEASAKALVDSHPLRQRRYFFSDRNPLVAAVAPVAEAMRETRRKPDPDNVFLQAERLVSDAIVAFWDSYRDLRDSYCEFWFNAVYGAPLLQALVPNDTHRVSETPGTDLRAYSNVHAALESVGSGGFAEAVIRMLILLAHSRSSVRRDRLERSNHVLTTTEPFASLGAEKRNKLIHRQSLIVDFEPDQALLTLPQLLVNPEDRRRAMAICEEIVGAPDEMEERTIAIFDRLRDVLDLQEPPAVRPKSRRAKPVDAAS